MYLLEIYVYQIDKQKQTKLYQTNLKTRQISFCDVHDEWGILGRVHSLLQRCVQIPFSYHVDQRLWCWTRPGNENKSKFFETSDSFVMERTHWLQLFKFVKGYNIIYESFKLWLILRNGVHAFSPWAARGSFKTCWWVHPHTSTEGLQTVAQNCI